MIAQISADRAFYESRFTELTGWWNILLDAIDRLANLPANDLINDQNAQAIRKSILLIATAISNGLPGPNTAIGQTFSDVCNNRIKDINARIQLLQQAINQLPTLQNTPNIQTTPSQPQGGSQQINLPSINPFAILAILPFIPFVYANPLIIFIVSGIVMLAILPSIRKWLASRLRVLLQFAASSNQLIGSSVTRLTAVAGAVFLSIQSTLMSAPLYRQTTHTSIRSLILPTTLAIFLPIIFFGLHWISSPSNAFADSDKQPDEPLVTAETLSQFQTIFAGNQQAFDKLRILELMAGYYARHDNIVTLEMLTDSDWNIQTKQALIDKLDFDP